jgi:H+/Cl- antiporter ClcA
MIKREKLQEFVSKLVVWIAAVVAGLIIVCFAKLSEYAISIFQKIVVYDWWITLFLTPVMGMLLVVVTRKWFSQAEGSGIPQTIAALGDDVSERKIKRLLSVRLALAKIGLVTLALLGGFSVGREGPSVQIGAAVMYGFKKYLPKPGLIRPKHLILAGGAAGISAAFNTPLAGIVFAIEELGRRYEEKTNGILITAIVLSGLVSISIQGNYTYFGNLHVININQSIIFPILVCGVVCGILGGVFSRILIISSHQRDIGVGNLRQNHPVIWAGICGLVIAFLGVASMGAAHGSGYTYTRHLLEDSSTGHWYYAPVKFLSTLLTYLSGIPGGIFAPSLSIGAGIGYDINSILQNPALTNAILGLCMTAFLSAVTQTPLTSFIIVMEMINGHEMVISLMTVALIATLVARIFSPPIYFTLAHKYK